MGKTAIHYTPGKQRRFARSVGEICAEAMAGALPLTGPIELSIVAVYLRPKSHRKRQPPKWKTSRSDLDNICKLVGDGLNKIAFADDAQIASLHAWKTWGDRAELLVKVVGLPAA